MPRCCILIPAYQPDERLYELVRTLSNRQLPAVVVDDGSTVGGEIFDRLEKDGVPVLHHEVNRGKGRALKTGLAYLAAHGYEAAVTADADGQHTVSDILAVMQAMDEQPGKLVLGVRDVAQMPPRSRTGNSITRALFRLLYGIRLTDTQTGLRGIPLTAENTAPLTVLAGERYEYEMVMLMESGTLFPAGIAEIPIATIYYGNNETSHFRALRDGSKIYAVLLRRLPGFLASSLTTFGVDYALFNLLYYQMLGRRTIPATVLARLVSATANYEINKHLVFRAGGGAYNAWNYFKLAACLLAANSLLMYLLVDIAGLPAFAVKIFAEILLYAVSFSVQNACAVRKKKSRKMR